jgi:hypothetical protein
MINLSILIFSFTNKAYLLLRFSIPIIIVGGAIVWVLYLGIVKNNWKGAMDIAKPAAFFGAAWVLIYYFIFS